MSLFVCERELKHDEKRKYSIISMRDIFKVTVVLVQCREPL